ncbi:MAG: glycosyltransferase family 2 protein [Candidatus Wildermuthbacteria bacterium]|nr:glycosyltransferase family 2 protein [Candidatus Wildermuthbacteria bacterium]
MEQDYYLRIGRAGNLTDFKERLLYRFFEMLPGLLSIGFLGGAVVASWLWPVQASFFMIAFALYWLLRTLYFLFHLKTGYDKMRLYEKTDWIKKLEQFPEWRSIYHLVILPTYKESFEILHQTIRALSQADYPKDHLIVVFGIEEAEGETGEEKARLAEQEFGKDFFSFLITRHPRGRAGEIAGKGSNETWAAKEAVRNIIEKHGISKNRVIVSSFDADTVVFPSYFSCLTYQFLAAKDPFHTSFQPVPLFLNNIWEAPAISKIFGFSSTFWYTINQERPEKLITYSSHSMSLRALLDVGYKQTDVVSDDSRIFWQCFLRYDGNYRVQPLSYPVSMDANVASSLWGTLRNIYRQQRRWAYGVADIPYFLFGFLKNKKIPLSKKLSLGLELIEGHLSWATAPILLFFVGWLPVLLGGSEFSHTLLAYNLPGLTSRILTLAGIGLILSAIISVNLLPPRKPEYGKVRVVLFALQWVLFPLTMVFFAALPALDAQIRLMLGRYMGFWHTPKFR